MSRPEEKKPSVAAPSTPMSPGPRNSNVSDEPRASHSQSPEQSCKLKILRSPAASSEFSPNLDIVALHGLSEDADSSWVYTKGANNSASSRRDGPFIPTVETIKESSLSASSIAGNFVKNTTSTVINTVGTAAKQLPNQHQPQASSSQTLQTSIGIISPKDETKPKAPNIQSSNASSISETLDAAMKVNWLKDDHMLSRFFPRARIMQFSYPTSLVDTARNSLKAIAFELLRRVEEERKDCGSGLSRPIIFIGHSFGGIVVSEALILARESHPNIIAATVGLLFLGTPFKGSKPVVERLRTRPNKTKSKFGRGPPKKSDVGTVAQAHISTAGSTTPRQSVEPGQLYTLLDTSLDRAVLDELREELDTATKDYNIGVACFYEKLETEAMKPFAKERLVEKDSAVLEGSFWKLEVIGLCSTHTNLCKFYGVDDPSFIRVKQTIKGDIEFAATCRLWDAISTGNIAEVEKQITKGANANQGNSRGRTSLHLAVEAGSLEIVRLLLENGVEVNAKDIENQSPLRQALLKDKYDIARTLLKRGAKTDNEDEKIALKVDEENRSSQENQDIHDRSFQQLLKSVNYFEGPRIRPKKKQELTKFDAVPDTCREAAGEFRATITTFHLRSEKDSEEKIRSNAPLETSGENVVDDDEREYHVVETMPLSKLLYGDAGTDLRDESPSEKSWKWYHLPANNMDWVEALFIQLGIDNADERLSGQEHRGRFPHTLFLQPQANVYQGDQNGRKDTVLFMPYLHFETNEGRIRLSNAIKRTASSLAKSRENDDAGTIAQIDLEAEPKENFNDGNESSEDDSDREYFRERIENKVEPFKKKFKSFRKAIRHCKETLLGDEDQQALSEDDKLVQAYLALHGHRLHIRRTLDQFYYIGMEDTEGRDTNQVVQRYAAKELDKIDDEPVLQSKLIMVDQLWLWVLGTNIVITSFPQGWGQASGSKDDDGGVLQQIESYLRKPIRDPIMSVDALASVIIKECTRVFGRFQVPKPELQFLDFFDSSISDVADRHSNIFAKLDVGWDNEKDSFKPSQRKSKAKTKQEKKKEKKDAKTKAKLKRELKEAQLDINEEVELLVEIQDIQDELHIIKLVLDDQHVVLSGADTESQKEQSAKLISRATFPHVDGKPVDNHVRVNRKTIDNMIVRAKDVYNAIYHLIDLKQKQANITEARYARKEANSAAKEGRTILALTIVNMIFLPLSFMSSFFALDIAEFPKDPQTGQTVLHLRWVSQYVFGISVAIAIPSIAIAMAIGPMAGFTKRVGKFLGHWGWQAVGVVVIFLIVVLLIGAIPVAAGLGVAGAGVALAAFILYFIAIIIFEICKSIWHCTPWYHRREAREVRERSDLEHAARIEGSGIYLDRDPIEAGESRSDSRVNEKETQIAERNLEIQNHGELIDDS